jgi:hypothetical protein
MLDAHCDTGNHPNSASKLFGDGDASVLATCTSYCDCGVPLILTGVSAKGGGDHLHQALKILFNVRLTEDERLDIGVKARLIAEVLAPEGVWQKSHIGNNVRVRWNTVFETEGFDHDVDFRCRFGAETGVYECCRLVSVEIGCIDDDVCFRLDGVEALAFTVDTVKNCAVGLKRMWAPNRLETLHEARVRGVEEEDAQIDSFSDSSNERLQVFNG